MTDVTMREHVHDGKAILNNLLQTMASVEKSEVASKMYAHIDHLLQVLESMDEHLNKASKDPDSIIDGIIAEVAHELASSMEAKERGAGPPSPTLSCIYGARELIKRKKLAFLANHHLDKALVIDFKQRFGTLRAHLSKAVKAVLVEVLAKDAELATLGRILH